MAKRFLLLFFVFAFASSFALAATQEAPVYPNAYWVIGTLNRGTAPSAYGYKVVVYKDSRDPSQAYATSETDTKGWFSVNPFDDQRFTPEVGVTYYIGVVPKVESDGKSYGVPETPIVFSDADKGYKIVSLTLQENQGVNDPEHKLGKIAGIVKDASTGTGISGALVAAGGVVVTSTPSFEIMLPAGFYKVTCTKEGYDMREYDGIEVKEDQTTTLEIWMVPNSSPQTYGSLTGRVLDGRNNRGIYGASVSVVEANKSTSSGSGGEYLIVEIPPGVYQVRAESLGFAPTVVQNVEIKAGETTSLDIILQLLSDSNKANLVGYVRDSNTGQPLSGAEVYLGSNYTQSGPDGRYGFYGMDPGLYPATCSYPNYNSSSTMVELVTGETKQLDFDLVPTSPGMPLTILTESLPTGEVNQTYTCALQAQGGAPPYRWSVDSGSLPSGLTLNETNGVISGVPSQEGGYSFNAKVTDSVGASYVKSFEILILPPAGLGPKLEMKVLLEGFKGKAATILVEARNENGSIEGRCLVPLKSDGTGTNNGTWIGNYPADYPHSGGSYYLVIHHRLGNFEGNHIPVITKDPLTLTDGTTISVNLAEQSSPNFKEVFTPQDKVPALKTLPTGELAMRAGYLNNDKIIDIGDYSVWKGAVTPQGTVDPANENSVRSDMNGDNIIDIGDYSLWKGTVQDFTPNGVPQTGEHVYVP